MRTCWQFLRYVMGLLLAGASSLLVFWVLLLSLPGPSLISFVFTIIMMAFTGVVSGAFVVQDKSRIAASSLYTILGALYYLYVQQSISYGRNESAGFPLLIPLLAGGVLGVCLHI